MPPVGPHLLTCFQSAPCFSSLSQNSQVGIRPRYPDRRDPISLNNPGSQGRDQEGERGSQQLRGIATPTSVVFFADSGWERETQLGEHAAQPGEREAVFQMPPGRQRLYLLGLPPGGAVQLQHAGGSVPITVDPDGLAKMEMGTFCITCGPSAPRLFSIRWGGS